MFHNRTKHIIVKYHSIRDVVSKGTIKIGKISTQVNPSDMGIKVIPLNKILNSLKFFSNDSLLFLDKYLEQVKMLLNALTAQILVARWRMLELNPSSLDFHAPKIIFVEVVF